MAWRTPRGFLNVVGAEKFARLTNEPKQLSPIGKGDAAETRFETPFAFGSIVPYLDGVKQTAGFSVSRETGPRGRDELVFTPAPGLNVVIEASSPDAVNVDVYETAAAAAQGEIRGHVDAVQYDVPSDDATTVPAQLLAWFDVIVGYLLAAAPRRPGLLDAYPELARRYDDVVGGVDSTLKRVAKGTFSLRGILPYRSIVTPAPSQQQGGYTSRPRVYEGGKGVF